MLLHFVCILLALADISAHAFAFCLHLPIYTLFTSASSALYLSTPLTHYRVTNLLGSLSVLACENAWLEPVRFIFFTHTIFISLNDTPPPLTLWHWCMSNSRTAHSHFSLSLSLSPSLTLSLRHRESSTTTLNTRYNFPTPEDFRGERTVEGYAGPTTTQVKGRRAWRAPPASRI